MINRHLAHLWRQMKIHRILTHVCLHQIGCLCYYCYAKTSSPKTSQQSVRKHYRPLLLFNSPWLIISSSLYRSTVHGITRVAASIVCTPYIQMYGMFCFVQRTSTTHNLDCQDAHQLKIVFYRLTPRSKTYSLIFLYDEFMMYNVFYNFQLYSLHKQSVLM